MTDYFALLGEARQPWLDPDTLKEKYFALARTRPADAELNEAFRVLSEPKLRLHHLLTLEGAELTAGRPVPSSVAELFWNTGTLLREIERWLLRNKVADSALARALLSGERASLEGKLEALEARLNRAYEAELTALRKIGVTDVPNEIGSLIRHYDLLSYLTRLRAQVAEKRFRLQAPG